MTPLFWTPLSGTPFTGVPPLVAGAMATPSQAGTWASEEESTATSAATMQAARQTRRNRELTETTTP
jgi:hypothetical protein